MADLDERRQALNDLIKSRLKPIAERYGFGDGPLDAAVRWRPLVLILGNYSSGKSTFINELIGAAVQATGQAPTDDAFTIITHSSEASSLGPIGTQREREGNSVLADPELPFTALKRHGSRLAAHLRLKEVNSPFLASLALIDTPGMLDSGVEAGRGYDYQAVIGDLASLADLILVLFDPHKAGTIREAYASLKTTLPAAVAEDRVVFVLNRVDECDNLSDLLRVFGTLCWNLSQMLARKDMPPIRLSFADRQSSPQKLLPEHLKLLINERSDLKTLVANAPRFRLDHLAAHAEQSAERLEVVVATLLKVGRLARKFWWCWQIWGIVLSSITGLAVWYAANTGVWFQDQNFNASIGGLAGLASLAVWSLGVGPVVAKLRKSRSLTNLETMVTLENDAGVETWKHVKPTVIRYLKAAKARPRLRDLGRDQADLCSMIKTDLPALRQ